MFSQSCVYSQGGRHPRGGRRYHRGEGVGTPTGTDKFPDWKKFLYFSRFSTACGNPVISGVHKT